MTSDAPPVATDWMNADLLAAVGAVGTLALSLLLAFASLVLGLRDRSAKRTATKMEQARAFAHVEVDNNVVRWRVVNASPYPIRQVRVIAGPFTTGASGKEWVGNATRNLDFSVKDIAPGVTHEEVLPRALSPYWNDLLAWADYAAVLHFIDFEGNHWVRKANGKVVPFEKLKKGGFGELPRTLYEPDKPRRQLFNRSRS